MIHYLHYEQGVQAPLDQVWAFFADPRNLNAITPPDLSFHIVRDPGQSMYEGQIIEYRVSFVKAIWSKWLTEITHVQEGRYFVDEQRVGPYKLWHHEHHFNNQGDWVLLRDQVTFVVGFGLIGDLIAWLWIKRKLAWIFDYRRKKIAEMFQPPDSVQP